MTFPLASSCMAALSATERMPRFEKPMRIADAPETSPWKSVGWRLRQRERRS
jgi:hypothetical protein